MSLTDLGIPQLGDARLIGSGGYSEVYVAHHQGLGRLVAVKVVGRIDDPRRMAEFERECAAMGRLSDHPNVVVPLSAGVTADGGSYLILEHYPDGSCADLVSSVGPLPPVELADWVQQVGGALGTAHARGVLHNDVKPGNVLVRTVHGRRSFAVTDFGLAHLMDGHTGSGSTAGSLLYVAPELLDGAPPCPASDVYGLAATACFMASGSAPFERSSDESWISLLRRVATEPVDPETVSAVPPDLRPVVHRALSKGPHDRPGLDELLRAAELAAAPTSWVPAPPNLRPTSAVEPTPEGAVDDEDPGRRSDESDGMGAWVFVAILVGLFVVSVLIGSLFR